MQDENKSSDSDSEGQDAQQDREHDKGEQDEEKGNEDSGYTFSLTETTILEVVMDSMRTCGLALALQAFSTILLGRMQMQRERILAGFLHLVLALGNGPAFAKRVLTLYGGLVLCHVCV